MVQRPSNVLSCSLLTRSVQLLLHSCFFSKQGSQDRYNNNRIGGFFNVLQGKRWTRCTLHNDS